MNKKVIIVGAGIAGLAAAVYAQRSGLDVTLIEQHSIVGGMCTSWKRKGYLFEGAIHWLTGSNPTTSVYEMWQETGALNKSVPIFLNDPFRSVEWEGQIINLYRNIDKTAEHMRKISPADDPLIKKLIKNVKASCNLQMPVIDIKGVKAENPKRMSLGFLFKMLPVFPVMSKFGKISTAEFVDQFQHPGIRRLLRIGPDEYNATSLIFTLATLHAGDGGYPEGGSLSLTQRMAKTFTDLGGKLILNAQVQKVNIQNNIAIGVTLAKETLPADAVIITQETIAALEKLFDTPPDDPWITELRRDTEPAVCTFISIGVRAELPDHMLPEWKLETPITYAGKVVDEIGFNSYRQYAPAGGTALTTILMGDTYDFWAKAKTEGHYDEEKQALAEQISRALCVKYPQCEGKIEVIDVATPLTYERYTGAYHGSWMGVTRPKSKMKTYSGVCESVKGLYFAGQRIMPPGGLPGALSTGRTAAQQVCRQFVTVFK